MPDLRIGISGWTYPPWRGVFFPKGLAQKHELAHASRKVNSIEINGTFYSLQTVKSFEKWYGETPDGFVFSVKAPRFITHIKRLRNVEEPLANFFASGVMRLKDKLGPFLWQLPPTLKFDPEVLTEFFEQLPRDTNEAAKLAKGHSSRIKIPDTEATGAVRSLRHAIEVRHPSFNDPNFIQLLRKHRIALVVADTAGKWPLLYDVTADFIYVRLHGDEELYVSGYTPEAIRMWERRVRTWAKGGSLGKRNLLANPAPTRAKGRDVYVYFDNDAKIKAPFDARALAGRLKVLPDEAGLPEPRTLKSKIKQTKAKK